jgi:hypothetical protein
MLKADTQNFTITTKKRPRKIIMSLSYQKRWRNWTNIKTTHYTQRKANVSLYHQMSNSTHIYKENGDIAGIPENKPLVTHLARKKFATTFALSNGDSK